MRRNVFAVLLAVAAVALAAKPVGSGLIPALPFNPATTSIGPARPADADPQILAIRAQQRAALAHGDRAELKRLEGEVQAIYLRQQPASLSSGLTVRRVAARSALRRFDGADAVIAEGRFIATAADYTMDGNIYVAAFHLDDSTTRVYRSTDHGSSWEILIAIATSSPSGRLAIPRLGLCVGEGDSAFIHVFMVVPDPYRDLVLARLEMDGSDFTTYGVRTGSDTVTDAAICRDYSGSNYWLYAVAVNGERLGARNAFYLRSTDYGKTWAVTDTGASDVHPHYSFGAGSWLYHALEGPDAYAKGEVWLFYNPVYGAPGQWQVQTVKFDSFSVRDPVIAPAFTLPESTAAVWTAFSYDFNGTGDWDILFAWSTDGGRSWPGGGSISGYPDSLEQYPDLRNYTSLGNTYINSSYILESPSWRTVFRRYSNSGDPIHWSDTVRINGHSAGTGRAVRPLLVYSPGGPGPGSGCVFVGAGLQNLYFNAPWLTGVAEQTKDGLEARFSITPNPAGERVRFNLPRSDGSRLVVYDAAGREVARLRAGADVVWDRTDAHGDRVPAGVYITRLVSAERSTSRRLVLR
jgi:hypothetical protein